MKKPSKIKMTSLFMLALTHIGLAHATESERALRIVNPDTLFNPAPFGFSHIVEASSIDAMIFISGQGGEEQSGRLPPEFEQQVKNAYRNLSTALNAVDASTKDVVKLNTYVVNYDQSKLAVMTKHLRSTFGDWLPAQTLVPVPRLALDGMLFEVDATVIKSTAK